MAQQRIGGFLTITLLLAALLIIAVFAVGGRDRDRSEIIEQLDPISPLATPPATLLAGQKPLPRTQPAEKNRQESRRAQPLPARLGNGPGLGLTRASLQRFFESPKLGFKFKNTTLRDGRPGVEGKSQNGIAQLELLGPSNNLTVAAITIGTSSDTPESVVEKAAYMVGFVKQAMPEWPGAMEWVSNNLERAAISGAIKTIRDAKEISITVDQELSTFAISVKAAP